MRKTHGQDFKKVKNLLVILAKKTQSLHYTDIEKNIAQNNTNQYRVDPVA